MAEAIPTALIRNVDEELVSLNNGNIRNINRALRRAAIPSRYFWPKISVDDAMLQKQYISIAIAATYGVIIGHTHGIDENGPSLLDTTGDLRTFVDFGLSDAAKAQARYEAIAIGAIRWAAQSSWSIDDTKLIPKETYQHDEVYALAEIAADGATTLGSSHTDTDSNLTRTEAALLTFGDLSESESEVAFAWYLLGCGLVPNVGCELLTSGHHVLASGMKAITTMLGQVVKNLSPDGLLVYNAMKANEGFVINVCHKAIHSVDPDWLTQQALSTHVPDRLRQLGIGSAAVRLPWTEDTLKAANSMVAVVHAVQAFCEDSETTMEVDRLAAVCDLVKTHTNDRADAKDVVIRGYTFARTGNKLTDIETFLVPEVKRVTGRVAVACGMLRQTAEDGGTNWRKDSKLCGHRIRKIMLDETPSINIGMSAVSNFSRYKRTLAMKDTYAPGSFSDRREEENGED